jgi:hypothetical protein
MGGSVCPEAPPMGGGSVCPEARLSLYSTLPLCSLVGASCLKRGGCERERVDDVMLTS